MLDTIYCEDCLKTMSRMPDDFVDLVVTSPPYNIGKSRLNSDYQKVNYDGYNDNLKREVYFDLTVQWITALLRVTRYHVFWNVQEVRGNWGIIDVIRQTFKSNLKEVFIWAKTNPACAVKDHCVGSGFEYIFCISKDKPSSREFHYCNFNQKRGDYINNVLIHPSNSNKTQFGGVHSFAFPSWLPLFFINNFSHEGDTVYDPFMGSGTTGGVAVELNRHYIGSEIVSKNVQMSEALILHKKSKQISFFKPSEKYKPISFFKR